MGDVASPKMSEATAPTNNTLTIQAKRHPHHGISIANRSGKLPDKNRFLHRQNQFLQFRQLLCRRR
jgi:hypothetical protein